MCPSYNGFFPVQPLHRHLHSRVMNSDSCDDYDRIMDEFYENCQFKMRKPEFPEALDER